MPKGKGIKGGRLVTIKTEEEYEDIINFLLNKLNLKTKLWSKEKRKQFKKKANRFEVRDDGVLGDWPHGKTLHVKLFAPNTEILAGTKLLVPPWKKKQILNQLHGDGKPCGHFGRVKLHKMASEKYYGITEQDCIEHVKDCPDCKVCVYTPSLLHCVTSIYFCCYRSFNPLSTLL